MQCSGQKYGSHTLTFLSLLLQSPKEVTAYVTPSRAGKRKHLVCGWEEVVILYNDVIQSDYTIARYCNRYVSQLEPLTSQGQN